MEKRIPASICTRQSLSELIEGRLASPDGRAELTRLIVEEALEAECREALGRDYYERGAEECRGYRNGVRTGRLKTAEGLIDFAAPQVAGREAPFRSEIRSHLKGRTEALEGLAVELLARGLSVRDIEDAFRDENGRLLLSRTAVSELGEQLWADYQDFASRDLSEDEIVYLFVDGIAERICPGQRREPVMAAWGYTMTGSRVLLHLMAGSKEDAETVSAFFQDTRARGLGDPLLVVSDGAPGVIKAIKTCFPRSARQRCLAHRMRNLAAKVPRTNGRSSRPVSRPPTRRRAGPSPAISPPASPPTTPATCPRPSPASKTTSRTASPTCACRSPTAARSAPRMRWTRGILGSVLFFRCADDLVAKRGASAASVAGRPMDALPA